MKIAFVGPGAIGCLFAAHCAEAGLEAVLVDRHPERARRIARAGVLLSAGGRTRRVRVPAVADPAAVGVCEFVCFCVKAYDTAEAARAAAPLVGPATVAVSLQNGLGNREAIAAALPGTPVLCAVTAQGATLTRPGEVRHAGWGPTSVAAADAGPAAERRAARFADLLRAAGLEAAVEPEVEPMLWSKLILNAAVNPVTALAGVPNGTLLEREELRAPALAAAREGQAVARARPVRLLYEDAAAEALRLCALTRENESSMLQDLRQGRRTEIEAITGVIVNEGRRLGLDVPTHEDLLRRVRAQEERTPAAR